MRIGSKRFTAGDHRRYVVDYCEWLKDGVWITDAQLSCDDVTVTIVGSPPFPLGVPYPPHGQTTTAHLEEGRRAAFYVGGGVVGTPFTVNIVATTSQGETKQDSILFNVEAV